MSSLEVDTQQLLRADNAVRAQKGVCLKVSKKAATGFIAAGTVAAFLIGLAIGFGCVQRSAQPTGRQGTTMRRAVAAPGQPQRVVGAQVVNPGGAYRFGSPIAGAPPVPRRLLTLACVCVAPQGWAERAADGVEQHHPAHPASSAAPLCVWPQPSHRPHPTLLVA